MTQTKIPVTVFTGFLGAGKTTIILSLLKNVPPDYKIVVLKNEFGDVEVDSALVRESNIEVQEMLNGCLCCVLVGQMKNALLELKEKYHPDRIIVETSGSAFPAPIAWQLREMADDGFVLDAILTVIDCVNFTGYEDTSYTAKMQAKYTDLILLNKHELVSERDLDIVIDHVNELNTDTPKITVDKDKGLSPDVAFGLDTKLFQITHHSDKAHMKDLDHHAREVDIIQLIRVRGEDTPITLSRTELVKFLESLPTEEVYRVKGFVRFQEDPNSIWIVNCAFGRCTLTEMTQPSDAWANDLVRITVMGRELRFLQSRLASGFQIPNDAAHVKTYWRPVGHH